MINLVYRVEECFVSEQNKENGRVYSINAKLYRKQNYLKWLNKRDHWDHWRSQKLQLENKREREREILVSLRAPIGERSWIWDFKSMISSAISQEGSTMQAVFNPLSDNCKSFYANSCRGEDIPYKLPFWREHHPECTFSRLPIASFRSLQKCSVLAMRRSQTAYHWTMSLGRVAGSRSGLSLLSQALQGRRKRLRRPRRRCCGPMK